MLDIGVVLHEEADACVGFGVEEIDQILLDGVQARWEAFVLDSIEVDARETSLPGDGIAAICSAFLLTASMGSRPHPPQAPIPSFCLIFPLLLLSLLLLLLYSTYPTF